MKVLVVGGGGREHALCWALAASPLLAKLWCAPGNAGIAEVAECVAIPAEDIAALVKLIEEDVISSKIARVVFDHMWAGEGAPAALVEAHGLVQVTDTGAIEAVIDAIIAANPDKAAAVKDRPQALGWFVGQVMKETAGKASPGAVNELLKAKFGVE